MNRNTVTTPILNIFFHHPSDEICKKYLEQLQDHILMKPLGKSVTLHLERLGKQSYCWTGEYKYWVWETEKWRIYVSNKRGVAFEVLETLSPQEAWDAWLDYQSKMGYSFNESV